MKFTCTQENLNRGLLIVSNIAGRSATLPILNNVLIKAGGGEIKLSTTNLEIGISVVIRGKVEKEGEFTVQARLLADYISLLPKENVEISVEDQSLNLKCGTFKTVIKGMEASEFPLIPEMDHSEEIQVKIKDFKKALSRVIFTVSLDESRPEISGVYFKFNANQMTVVGTDSYRLAEVKVQLDKNNAGDKDLIVPLRTVQELYRILSESGDKDVRVFLNENQILFKLNDETELTSRLVEGQYPDYRQIIPGEKKTEAKVRVAELIKVVKSASLFCKPGINDVKISFITDKNQAVVSSLNSAVGENMINFDLECSGEDNEVVFNYRYLLDGLNNLGSDEAELKIISGSAPGLIKPVGDDSYLYIIMPIRQ